MDILIEMDISYLFHNYKKRAEIAIISSDRGFDNYIKNFNILTGDYLILRRINRTSNIYEKLEENAEDCINTEKSAELTIERLKGNMPNLPKDLKSLKNIIANVAYAEKKKIDAEKVINGKNWKTLEKGPIPSGVSFETIYNKYKEEQKKQNILQKFGEDIYKKTSKEWMKYGTREIEYYGGIYSKKIEIRSKLSTPTIMAGKSSDDFTEENDIFVFKESKRYTLS